MHMKARFTKVVQREYTAKGQVTFTIPPVVNFVKGRPGSYLSSFHIGRQGIHKDTTIASRHQMTYFFAITGSVLIFICSVHFMRDLYHVAIINATTGSCECLLLIKQ